MFFDDEIDHGNHFHIFWGDVTIRYLLTNNVEIILVINIRMKYYLVCVCLCVFGIT